MSGTHRRGAAGARDRVVEMTREHIERFGWSVTGVAPTVDDPEPGPMWAYTIGLHEKFDHPELVMVSMSIPQAQSLLNILGTRIKGGERFRHDQVISDALKGGLPMRFRQVDSVFTGDWFNLGRTYYAGAFPCMQVLWPDAQGRLPGDNEFDERFAQALL